MYNFNVMFKKNRCEACHSEYDDKYEVCPYCKANELPLKKRLWGNKTIYLKPIKQIFFFVIGFGGLNLLALILGLLVQMIAAIRLGNVDAVKEFVNSVQYSAIVNFTIYGILVVGLLGLVNKDVIKLLKSFKNFLVPIAAIAGFAAVMIFNLIYSSILTACGINMSTNDNEQALDSIITVYPVLSILIFGIIGPLCEELTYRLGLYSFLRRINKYLAYAVTIVVFALIHFNFTGDMVIELLNLPFYIVAGFMMTFVYEKVGFAGSFALHSLNNLTSVLSQIILSLNH